MDGWMDMYVVSMYVWMDVWYVWYVCMYVVSMYGWMYGMYGMYVCASLVCAFGMYVFPNLFGYCNIYGLSVFFDGFD